MKMIKYMKCSITFGKLIQYIQLLSRKMHSSFKQQLFLEWTQPLIYAICEQQIRVIITKEWSIQKQEMTLCFQDLTYSISQRMTKHFQEQHVNFLTQSESRSTLKRSELTWKKASQSLFQRLILNIKVLFSVRHLKHRDEMKLDSLMEKWKK